MRCIGQAFDSADFGSIRIVGLSQGCGKQR